MVEVSQLADALRRALSRGEIAAWFQPQFGTGTQSIVGAEVLCRWHHRTWGPIPPSTFIPVAEQDGTIAEIGRQMTMAALSAMVEWGLDVSVNVSPAQLEDASYTTWLERVIRRVRRPARRLTLEITEGRQLADVPALVARLDRLRALGFGIAIDDVGSGQASLTQAKRLHATELKLDRSLIESGSHHSRQVIADTVRDAHEAGLRVVAEGIETPEQWELVSRLGCDRGQGYLLGRPVARAEMGDLVASLA